MRARDLILFASWGLLALAAGPLWAAERVDDSDAAPPPPPEINLPEPARAAPASSSSAAAIRPSPSTPPALPVPDADLGTMRDWTLGQTRAALFEANETLALAKREHAAVMAAIAAGAIPPAPAAAAVTASGQAAPVTAPAPTKAAPVKALPAPPVNPPAAAVTAPQPQTVTLQLAPQPAPQPQTITLQLVAAPSAAVAAPVASPVAVAPLEARIRHAGPIRKGLAGIGNALSHAADDKVVIRQPRAKAVATVVPVQYTVSAPSVASVPAPTAAVVAPAPVTASPQNSSAGATVLGGNFWNSWFHR